jgi:hypothetical protein
MTDEEEYDIEESAAAAAGTRRRRRPSSTDSFRTAPGRNSSFGLSAEVRANRCGAAADNQKELNPQGTHARMLGMRVRGTTDADAASGSRAALVAT